MNVSCCLILSYCPSFIFILKFCVVHISKTLLAMAMKFCGWLQLGVRLVYLATVCPFCSLIFIIPR